ncbi:MAG: hypothetical protein K2X81_14965 [Candidatus Obscuribacterales bacterium]|nr:hypothetical protein [Candidatus Obscuribacterales bacterium]
MSEKLPSKQPTVRVNLAAKQKLDHMQRQTDLSQPALLDRAIALLERELVAKQMEDDFAFIAANDTARQKYNQVCDVFESASSDGLD